MTKENDLKKKIEGLFGKDLSPDVLERIRWSYPIASYNFVTEKAYISSINLILPFPLRCNPYHLFDVSGVAATGTDGKRVFRLREYACLGQVSFENPINVVATPLSSDPCFVTVKHALLPDWKDVEISVFSWDAKGAAAPNIAFDWRCRVPYFEIIL